MTTTNVSQAILATVTITTNSGTIASGGFFNSGTVGVINNTPTASAEVAAADLMDLFINIGTAQWTLGATASLAITCIDQAQDGSGSFVNPGTNAAAPPNLAITQTIPLNGGAVLTGILELTDIQIRPYEFLTLIQNNSGTIMPSATITAVRKYQQLF